LRCVRRVDIAVDEAGRDVEEPARFDLDALVAARAELESSTTADDVAEDVSIPMVMPARSGAGLGTSAHERRRLRLDGQFAQNPRCRRAGFERVRRNSRDATARSHAGRLLAPLTSPPVADYIFTMIRASKFYGYAPPRTPAGRRRDAMIDLAAAVRRTSLPWSSASSATKNVCGAPRTLIVPT